MIKVLIADDEKHARERLKELLLRFNIFTIESEAKNGDEVIQKIISEKPDVVFLDINMPGVSVFTSISSLKDPPVIVFQTAHSEYAVNAFGINALDYILKPVSEERLKISVSKILKALSASDSEKKSEQKINEFKLTTIAVKNGSIIKLLPINEIYFITFDEGISFIHTASEKFIDDKYLNYYEANLDENIFFRANRKDLININHINSIHPMFNGNYIIEMKNSTKIILSRRRTKELKDRIKF
jgi:two-component system, LytTR family, response regulator